MDGNQPGAGWPSDFGYAFALPQALSHALAWRVVLDLIAQCSDVHAWPRPSLAQGHSRNGFQVHV